MTGDVIRRAEEIEKLLPRGGFTAAVPITDRVFWEKAGKQLNVEELLTGANQHITKPFPVMTDEIYFMSMDDAKNFHNNTSDQISFRSMRILEKTVLAECVENEGRFIPYIVQWIETILDRKSWVRANHDKAFGYCDYYGRHPLIDLYSASVAWRLATCDALLAPVLSDSLRKRIKENVSRRVIDVFIRRLYENHEELLFNGKEAITWVDGFDNWLAVCLSCVVGAGIYYGDFKQKAFLIAVYEKLIQNYKYSLPGGYCIEGVSYWGYGFGKFVAASDIIYRATDGAIDLYTEKGFVEAADFGFKIAITENTYPCNADCAFDNRPLPYCLKYYANRAGVDYDYPYEAVSNDIYIVMLMLNWDSRLTGSIHPDVKETTLRTYFEGQGMLISRTEDKDFGMYVQGGHNHAPHNHNDIGSFVVAAGDERFIVDPGIVPYRQGSFSPERYEAIRALSSYGHSVPRVCGQLQGPAKFYSVNTNYGNGRTEGCYDEIKYRATVLETEFTDKMDRIRYDMKNAYECPQLMHLTREVIFDRTERSVLITDEFTFTEENEIETAFVTMHPVELCTGNSCILKGKEHTVTVEFLQSDARIRVDTIKECMLGKEPLYPVRIAFAIRGVSGKAQLRISLTKESGEDDKAGNFE